MFISYRHVLCFLDNWSISLSAHMSTSRAAQRVALLGPGRLQGLQQNPRSILRSITGGFSVWLRPGRSSLTLSPAGGVRAPSCGFCRVPAILCCWGWGCRVRGFLSQVLSFWAPPPWSSGQESGFLGASTVQVHPRFWLPQLQV